MNEYIYVETCVVNTTGIEGQVLSIVLRRGEAVGRCAASQCSQRGSFNLVRGDSVPVMLVYESMIGICRACGRLD